MIIDLIKEQNIFFLLKELWGPWAAKHVLTTDFVWLIYHYFIINCYAKHRDTRARRM